METLFSFLPAAGVVVAVIATLFIVHRVLVRDLAAIAGHQFRNQVIMLALTGAGLLIIILAIPISDAMRGQLLGLIGILLSAAIALSSTTVLGNAMAGMMLRAIRNFRMGDFIQTGEHFGRVSERGLFHTEIQTEHRELTTLPNLYLVTHPVTTIRSSGTIVSATVSLGYDVPRPRVEEVLLAAAVKAELQEPFVHLLELGDFSAAYRVAGLLTEVKNILSARSRLRKCVMDSLHQSGIEIVSPNFMNTRALTADRSFIPAHPRIASAEKPGSTPEKIVFDKAEEAESLEELRTEYAKMTEQIEAQEEAVKAAEEGPLRERAGVELARLRSRREGLERIILARESETGKEK